MTSVPIELVGSAVVGVLTVGALGDEADVLNFLIDGVLQKIVKLLNFLFDLADVREFDFHGRTEAVTAVLWQTELLAVVGAEFDGHDVLLVGCGHKKARPCEPG